MLPRSESVAVAQRLSVSGILQEPAECDNEFQLAESSMFTSVVSLDLPLVQTQKPGGIIAENVVFGEIQGLQW